MFPLEVVILGPGFPFPEPEFDAGYRNRTGHIITEGDQAKTGAMGAGVCFFYYLDFIKCNRISLRPWQRTQSAVVEHRGAAA